MNGLCYGDVCVRWGDIVNDAVAVVVEFESMEYAGVSLTGVFN